MSLGKDGEHLTEWAGDRSCKLVKVELSGNTYVFTLAELSTSIELCLIELHRCTVANGEDDERLTESRKVQFRHITIDLFRPEVNVSLAGLGFLPRPQQIMLRHLFRERTGHLEGRMASGSRGLMLRHVEPYPALKPAGFL